MSLVLNPPETRFKPPWRAFRYTNFAGFVVQVQATRGQPRQKEGCAYEAYTPRAVMVADRPTARVKGGKLHIKGALNNPHGQQKLWLAYPYPSATAGRPHNRLSPEPFRRNGFARMAETGTLLPTGLPGSGSRRKRGGEWYVRGQKREGYGYSEHDLRPL